MGGCSSCCDMHFDRERMVNRFCRYQELQAAVKTRN
jgi:hypothetical protein